MNGNDLLRSIEMLTAAETAAEIERNYAFDHDEPAECRKWLMRRDHFREARQALRSMLSDLDEKKES